MTQPLFPSDASRNSTMKRWLHRNRVRFTAELAEAGKPNWTAIAQMMSDLGLRDAKGGKPNRHTAMMTWRRVAAEVSTKVNRRQPPKPIEPTPQPKPSQPIETGQDQDAEARLRHLQNQIARRSVR